MGGQEQRSGQRHYRARVAAPQHLMRKHERSEHCNCRQTEQSPNPVIMSSFALYPAAGITVSSLSTFTTVG